MRTLLGLITAGILYAPTAVLAESLANTGIAIVNTSQLFATSSFVKNANTTLQNDIKSMENTLKAERVKLQILSNEFTKMKEDKHVSEDKKAKMMKALSEQQATVNKFSQEFQMKIQNQRSEGMQKFSKYVQEAIEKVAKEKDIHTVLNSTAVLYTDKSWSDITSDVEKEMK